QPVVFLMRNSKTSSRHSSIRTTPPSTLFFAKGSRVFALAIRLARARHFSHAHRSARGICIVSPRVRQRAFALARKTLGAFLQVASKAENHWRARRAKEHNDRS